MRTILALAGVIFLGTAISADEPAHLLLEAKAAKNEHVRDAADYFLLINSAALAAASTPEAKAEVWKPIREELAKTLGDTRHHTLHVRLFGRSKDELPRPLYDTLRTESKMQLADQEVYIVYLDWTIINGDLSWQGHRAAVLRDAVPKAKE